jgi:CubicO group peptidase (beta-lactamase class C family)
MSSRYRTLPIVVLLSAAGCPGAVQQVNTNLDRVCDSQGCISVNAFSKNIDNALRGKVTGYVSIVGGGLPAVVEYGVARTAADQPPEMKFLSSTPMNMASLTKVFTTVAVLQSMKKHSLKLTDPIDPYLPPDWTRAADGSTKKITFGDLLTHQSGFRTPQGRTDYTSIANDIASSVAATYHQPQYDNANFAIFRIALPYMEGWTDPGAATRDQASSDYYVGHMKKHVFEPVGITDAATKPSQDPTQFCALGYPNPWGNTPGDNWGDWTTRCGGGGWVLTAGDVYHVMNSLLYDTKLLDDSNPEHLDKQTMNANCLGWDCSVYGLSPSQMASLDFHDKNGGLRSGGDSTCVTDSCMSSYMGIFKGKVMAVVAVNTLPPGGTLGNITGIVQNAFKAAQVP